MKTIYQFFNELITVELDLEVAEQKTAYYLLKTIECMYESPNKYTFVELKKLINTSKFLHENIKLSLVPKQTLSTGAYWDVVDKHIFIELPDLREPCLMNYENYNFINSMIFELCNSTNKYLSSLKIMEDLAETTIGNADLYAFLKELTEYETFIASEHIRSTLVQNINNFLLSRSITSVGYNLEDVKHISNNMRIFSNLELVSTRIGLISFAEYWEHVNSYESSFNRGYSHADVYRNKMNSLANPDKYDHQLNKIYREIVQQLKQNSFDIELTRAKYTDLLIEVAQLSELKKLEYYVLYEIIMQNGKTTFEELMDVNSIEEPVNFDVISKYISCLVNMSSVIVKVAFNEIKLQEVSENDQKFIFLIFDIIDASLNDDLSAKDIYEIFIPELKRIEDPNNSIIAKARRNLLESCNIFILPNVCENIKVKLPETMELIEFGDGVRSIWKHQAEVCLFQHNKLFSFEKMAKINLVGGILNIDNDNIKYNSKQRICYNV